VKRALKGSPPCSLRPWRTRRLRRGRERPAIAPRRRRRLSTRHGRARLGVAIIACGAGEARAGCTASSVTSPSLAPPTLLVCLARTSTTLAGLRESDAFSINPLAARHQALAHRFSGHSSVHGSRRFDGGHWVTLSTGAPVLADALAAFNCLVEEVIERHSHAIVLGAVVSLEERGDEPVLGVGAASMGRSVSLRLLSAARMAIMCAGGNRVSPRALADLRFRGSAARRHWLIERRICAALGSFRAFSGSLH
jgi:flavin reductase (DIM6/NTAB) family NADH-FMN oxidoreductase RutF